MTRDPPATMAQLARHIAELELEAAHGDRHRQGLEDQSSRDQVQLAELTARAGRDEQRIADLEARHGVEELLIKELEAQGVVDRSEISHLQTALESARHIGAAIGILMATQGVDEQQAFEALKFVSQSQNRKLRDVAFEVVRTWAMTPQPPD